MQIITTIFYTYIYRALEKVSQTQKIGNQFLLLFLVPEFLHTVDGLILIDILLTLGGRYLGNLETHDTNWNSRPLWIIVPELLSLFPVRPVTKFFYPTHLRLICVISTIKVIRYVRICYFFYRLKRLILSSIYIKAVEMLCNFSMVILLADNIYCNMRCHDDVCLDGRCETYDNLFRLTGEFMSNSENSYEYNIAWNLVIGVSKLVVLFFVTNLTIALISAELIHLHAHQVSFVNEFTTLLKREEMVTTLKSLRHRVIEYYNNIWQTHGGYIQTDDFLSDLPRSFQNELMIDINWLAYKHSNLLRNMNLAFLRELSNYIKQQHMVPGEIIWDRNQLKEKMIYVVSGTIQFLSEEDGESPILAFTSGTCLGESSLLVSYKSRSTVRSKDFCDLCCLNRKDLLAISRKYPKQVKALQKTIMDRFDSARQLKYFADETKQTVKNINDNIRLDTYTIIWLKNTLHKLMSKDKESARRHEFQNIYLVSETNESCLNKLMFSARFLNSLVIAERLDVDLDTVFVKPTYPCVLHSQSFIVYLWEVLIIIITLSVSFIIPYSSFILPKPPLWYTSVIGFSTLIFWIDLYVQLSIGVTHRGSVIYSKFGPTAKAKMQTVGFWVDLFSCIPSEILTCITLRDSYTGSRAIMHINRLAKLWRVNRLFRAWENVFNANFVLIRFVKFGWINFYTIFMFWCLLYRNSKIPNLFVSVETVTGTAVIGVEGLYTHSKWVDFGANVSVWIITLFMRSNIVSAYVLVKLSKFEVQVFCEDVLKALRSNGLSTTYLTRIHTYLNTQWIDNRCLQLTNPKSNIANLPRVLFSNIFVRHFKDILLNQPFFKMLPLRCVCEIAGVCTRSFICSPNGTILYAGDMSSTVVIIIRGTYEVRTNLNESLGYQSTQITVNLLEAALRTPAANTYIAISYCKMLLLDIQLIESILRKDNALWADYKNTLKMSKDIKLDCVRLSNVDQSMYQDTISTDIDRSFYHFGYNLAADSYEEFDYYIPFDKIYPFSFLRYFLMRTVLLPRGKALLVWESFRCLFAVLSNLLYFTTPIMVNPEYKGTLIFLDISALVDIYVRLHVAYYNSDGILVKHPRYTAAYYISHGITLDLLAICPFSLLVYSQSLWFYIFSCNRLLQLHRYVQFFSMMGNQKLKPTPAIYILTYLPLILIATNFFGNWLITLECVYLRSSVHINEFIGVNCTKNSILITPRLNRPINRVKAHMYGVYVAVRLLLNVDVEGYSLKGNITYAMVAFISLLGYYLKTVLLGKIFTFYTIRRTMLLRYQQAMHDLRSYLKVVKVNPSLTQIIIDSYEFKWSCMKGRNVHNTMAPFYDTLATDTLYNIYGKPLYKTSIFEDRVPAFYRNLVKHMKHDIIKMGGYLSTLNDVTAHLRILYSGRAEVISPDGTVLDSLMPGSIFGNLENTRLSRLRVSVVASCHVEMLSIPAETFHRVLKYYPNMYDQFHLLKARYVRYIPAEMGVVLDLDNLKHSSTVNAFILDKTFNPNSRLIGYWNMFNLVYTCYVGIVIDLYQFGSIDYSLMIFFIQYTSDILYLLQFFIKERTAYEDESGILITDLKLIREHNRKNKLLFAITIVSFIPLDIPVLCFVKKGVGKFHLYSLTRCNRLLRLTYIFQYFENFTNKLNINLYLTSFTYIFMWTTLFFCGLASSIGFCSCFSPAGISGAVATCDTILEQSWFDKFKLYTKYFFIAVCWFTHSNSYQFYPQEPLPLFLYTCALMACLILNAICLSQIFSVISQCSIDRFTYMDVTDKLTLFMEREDVSDSLMDRISNYMEMLWLRTRGVVYPDLLREAPHYLQGIISYDAFAHLVVDHAIFKNFHPDCLRQIIQKMRTEIHFAGDYVQFKDTIDGTMYFIFKGEICVIEENELAQDVVVKKLGRSRSFGVLQGIYNRFPHEYTYQANATTILITLKKTSWYHLLDYFPASSEQIYENAAEYYGL